MEIATSDISDIENFILEFLSSSATNIDEMVESKKEDVSAFYSSYGFRIPINILSRKSQQVDLSINKILQSIEKYSMIYDKRISLLAKSLDAFDIQRVLKRGFVLVRQNSKFVTRAVDFNTEEKAMLKFYDGEISTH
jgi:exonuclease VII large subunit